MSDFDWSDHPVIDDSAPAQGSSFSWNDHPVVGASSDKAAQEDRGLVGKERDAENSVLHSAARAVRGGPFSAPLEVLDAARNTETGRRAVGYLGGLARTAVSGAAGLAGVPGQAGWDDAKNAAEGAAPSSSEYLARAGVTPGPSVNVPFSKQLFGHDVNISARDAEGFALDLLSDPVARAMGKAAAPAAEAAATKVGEAASEATPWVAKKAGKVIANVPEDVTARYIEHPKPINEAPSINNIADDILRLKKQTQSAVDTAQDNLVSAKNDFAEKVQDIRDAKNDARSGLQDQKADAQKSLQDARDAFNDRKQEFKEALKSNNLTSMASDVQGAVGDLKKQVIQGSGEAYSLLGNSKGSVSIKPIIKALDDHMAGMRVNGVSESPAADQAFNELTDWKERLQQMTKSTGGAFTLPQAKQVMQAIDKSVDYEGPTGSFAPQTETALKDVRSQIDQSVKGQSDPYKAKMAEVARKAKLLQQTSDLYGTPEKAISNLKSITSEKGQALHVPIIDQLGKETGRDFATPVKGYLLNHQIMTTPSLFDQTIENLPESKTLRAAETHLADIMHPTYGRQVTEAAVAPGIKAAEASRAGISKAQAALDAAKEKGDVFSGITPDSITGKTKQLNGANQYGANIRFDKIDNEFGTDFKKQIQNRNDLDAFGKDNTRGSRLAVAGGALGTGIGALVSGGGFEGTAIGGSLGAQAGAIADKYAGQIFKYALDKGMSVAEATKRYGPAAAKAAGIAGGAGAAAATELSETKAPSKGPGKWANDGLNALIDHAGDDKKTAALLQNQKTAMLADPKTKDLLIQASDLKSGTKAMDAVMAKLKARLQKGGS